MDDNNEVVISEKKLEVLVAKFIPTSQYFERSFQMLQKQIDGLSDGQKRIQHDMDIRFGLVDNRLDQMDMRFGQVDQRFEQVDKRFEQVDKRFEQVDKRFEQVDKRFDQVILSINRLSDQFAHLSDQLDNRDQDHRSFTLRMFSISIVISFLGVLGVFLKMFRVI